MAPIILSGLAAAAQEPVRVVVYTTAGCASATQVGPVDPSSAVFVVTDSVCTPTPNTMAANALPYLSYRAAYTTATVPQGTFCVATVYSDPACQSVVNSAVVGPSNGNDCNNAIPLTTTNPLAVGIGSFKVVCGTQR